MEEDEQRPARAARPRRHDDDLIVRADESAVDREMDDSDAVLVDAERFAGEERTAAEQQRERDRGPGEPAHGGQPPIADIVRAG